ncbi:nicotinamidase-related amidase [Actinomadura pelletieri DSM 43383]|uniref:Nicotinamidase-related amidase n=1 Tax=Actinomadura pelletieri DSM 43383 TaxID=1120940 RepID=A0A495QKS1_9ACTN|nr:isochorismatase family protein [Actinomadura pelletieri]RKS73149.1 nicotinamidase-related amidase [Actinomadura pelletieri DSM 43383]
MKTPRSGDVARDDGVRHLIAHYEKAGFTHRVGFGARPAVLVIDLVNAFTDPSSDLALPLEDVVRHSAELIAVAHDAGVPVIAFRVEFADERSAPVMLRKNPVLAGLRPGGEPARLDPRLGVDDRDVVLVKTGASAFFQTTLPAVLAGLGVDTVVLVGSATSGCVRATAVDAIQHGFRPIVVAECVGDRLAVAHEVSLAEMDAKYADVESLDVVIRYLKERA